MFEIPLCIADIPIRLRSPLSVAELGIEDLCARYSGHCNSEAVSIRICWEESEAPPMPDGDLIFDPGSHWRMYRAPYGFCAEIFSEHDITTDLLNSRSIVKADPDWTDISIIEFRHSDPWESLLRVTFTDLIVRSKIVYENGLIFHAAGVDDNGRGLAFLGHSGAGKSTLLGLWKKLKGVIPINEDRIAVRNLAKPICYRVPWGGNFDVSSSLTTLNAMIILEQSARTEIVRMSPKDSVGLLLVRAFAPYWDAKLMNQAISNLGAILDRVPVYLLRFTPDFSAVEAVRSVL